MTNKKPALDGRELSEAELTVIRRYLDEVDTISGISDDMLTLIAQLWPDQLVKLKGPKGTAIEAASSERSPAVRSYRRDSAGSNYIETSSSRDANDGAAALPEPSDHLAHDVRGGT